MPLLGRGMHDQERQRVPRNHKMDDRTWRVKMSRLNNPGRQRGAGIGGARAIGREHAGFPSVNLHVPAALGTHSATWHAGVLRIQW
jgi:hypothetical protein